MGAAASPDVGLTRHDPAVTAAAIAKVEPITTARALRGPFDYLRPDGVGKGSLLVVPFGRRDVTGVVVGVASSSEVPAEKLVSPRRVLEERVPPELVDLAAWMAEEYCSTFARSLQLVLPPTGARAKTALWAEATREAGEDERLTARQRDEVRGDRVLAHRRGRDELPVLDVGRLREPDDDAVELLVPERDPDDRADLDGRLGQRVVERPGQPPGRRQRLHAGDHRGSDASPAPGRTTGAAAEGRSPRGHAVAASVRAAP